VVEEGGTERRRKGGRGGRAGGDGRRDCRVELAGRSDCAAEEEAEIEEERGGGRLPLPRPRLTFAEGTGNMLAALTPPSLPSSFASSFFFAPCAALFSFLPQGMGGSEERREAGPEDR